ncbi:MAG TPA: cysteine desulfurase [Gemmatimonadales bacterium]|nr:cysteine desulfurase [Gemmatimonadales bacterium]
MSRAEEQRSKGGTSALATEPRAGTEHTAPPRFGSSALLGVERIRADFPILASTVRGKPLVYLDNAATTQKPRVVIDAIAHFYAAENANVHRGVHWLSERATAAYEGARERVARFLGAGSAREVVFTRGTTEAINLVAQSWGRRFLRPGDEVLVTAMEHHANIVPWQLLAEQTGIVLRVAPVTDAGELDLDAFARLLSGRVKLVSVVHLSNAIGTINPVRRLAELARAHGVPTLVDGAQSASHLEVDVAALGCDFFAFSGHKVLGPTGIGVLWAREPLLEQMPPWQGGGDMITSVSFERSTWAPPPQKFEAGTPHIAGAVGLAAALDYLETIGRAAVAAHERDVLDYAIERVGALPGVRLVGTAADRASILSFAVAGVHPHDVGAVLDLEGVAIRAGHHCAQPIMERMGVSATARASFALYNTRDEVDTLVRGIERVRQVFG